MLLAVFIGLLFVYSLVSARLEKTIITAPIVFTLAGIVVFFTMEPAGGRLDTGVFLLLAEIGLVLLLFTDAGFIRFLGEQLGLGLLVGAGVGLIGGWLLSAARRSEWMAESFLQLAVVSLPVFCILLSEHVGASVFIAAFVAGLFVQVTFKDAGKNSVEFAEEWGQILNLSVFFLFGMMIARNRSLLGYAPFFYALLSLTIVRMLPVAISLVGSGLDKATVAFMGWFGPRGLASIVLGLVYLEQEKNLPGDEITRLAVMATVLLSIFAHGLSAAPGIRMLTMRKTTPESP